MDDPQQSPPQRLSALLAPVHDRARATAQRLCSDSAEADDLFQDALMLALTRLGDLRDPKAFPAWFYRILITVHRSRYRRRFWRRLLPIEGLWERGGEPACADGDSWADQRDQTTRMRRALATLPAAQREAVVLADLDGFSLQEIAEIQRVSLSAVKSRVTRGRRQLRAHYEELARRGELHPSAAAWPGPAQLARAGREGASHE